MEYEDRFSDIEYDDEYEYDDSEDYIDDDIDDFIAGNDYFDDYDF